MRCMACYEHIPEGTEICPRCGFVHYQVIGDTDEALSALKKMAQRHRTAFLGRYDLGITAYTWKDQKGVLVPDATRRISFGTADGLLTAPKWLDQPFARLPQDTVQVELSVAKTGEAPRTVPVQLAVPQEAQLQYLGIAMGEDLSVRLLLKNESNQTESRPVAFL